jgi:hypothetical protein
MDKQDRTLIVVLGCIAFGLIFSLLYGIANELHDIRMELWNIKTKHQIIVEHQYKQTADTIVVYKERTIKAEKYE